MKVVLDANSLSSDHYLSGPLFTVVANEIADDTLEVVVPEVVVLETVGNHARGIDEAKTHLSGFLRKHGRLLPTSEVVNSVVQQLDEFATSYESTLRSRLELLGARVEPIPEVDHADLVRRATERRRPCDSNGNGYRDSLVWETILELADEGEDIIFVTHDSDFAAEGGDGPPMLHADLAEELQSASDISIELKSDLHAAIRELIPQGDAEEIAALATRVRLDLVNEWLVDGALYDMTSDITVDPELAALPRSTTEAHVNYVEDVSQVVQFSALRSLSDNVLVEFEVEASAEIEMWVDEWDTEEADMRIREHGRLGQVRSAVTKPVLFDCLATVDAFGRPQALEVTRVHARDDDPGLAVWDPEVCGCVRPPRPPVPT